MASSASTESGERTAARLATEGSEHSGACRGPAGGDLRFQGTWLEEGTGLYDVRAREYDPQVGRFTSRDPAEGRRDRSETCSPHTFDENKSRPCRDPHDF
ncbi:MAG: hypothetical protein CMN31_01780 [Sandaracinus sp.]|nr:hypothetical protein [Sandaracinus sp.]MBJ70092.1 hypothetical protein [Sandaracinus sp.]